MKTWRAMDHTLLEKEKDDANHETSVGTSFGVTQLRGGKKERCEFWKYEAVHVIMSTHPSVSHDDDGRDEDQKEGGYLDLGIGCLIGYARLTGRV
jgi:hypothetical protein